MDENLCLEYDIFIGDEYTENEITAIIGKLITTIKKNKFIDNKDLNAYNKFIVRKKIKEFINELSENEIHKNNKQKDISDKMKKALIQGRTLQFFKTNNKIDNKFLISQIKPILDKYKQL